MRRLPPRADRALRGLARRFGYHLVPADYHSPIPEVGALAEEIYERASPLPGIRLELERQLALLEGPLAPHLRELGGEGPDGFAVENHAYGPLDAETLYALIRERRPARVLELGSGFSTLVIQRAAAANARDGAPLEHVVVDPHPPAELVPVAGRVRLEQVPAQSVPDEQFAWLEAGDVLFVDTTHTVKVGGEVNRVILEVLPALPAGVLVHIHDVFLPFEYPRILVEGYRVAWQEQYLVQAFLSGNHDWAVLLANHALARLHAERVAALVPSLRPGVYPCAFWMERVVPG
jgi:hypothetical protein